MPPLLTSTNVPCDLFSRNITKIEERNERLSLLRGGFDWQLSLWVAVYNNNNLVIISTVLNV